MAPISSCAPGENHDVTTHTNTDSLCIHSSLQIHKYKISVDTMNGGVRMLPRRNVHEMDNGSKGDR